MSISLYDVFHEHLMSPSVEEGISTDDFVMTVVNDYLDRLTKAGHIINGAFKDDIKFELKDEVILMTRKKTYGHFSVATYRKSKLTKSG